MQDAPKRISVVRLLLRYLEQEGVEYIFGIPGGPIISFYEALYDRMVIKPILTKHEGGAAFMADAYARVSGKIGVCCTTTGPGATNALTGIAVAHADRVPVLILTPQSPTHQFGKAAFQESSPESLDTVALFRPVTKWSAMIPHPDRAGAMIRTALRLMTSGRPGPVHLSLPCNYATHQVAEELLPVQKYRFASRHYDRAAVAQAADALLRARRPVILAGQGVNLSRAWRPLRELAERFSIPVATTFKGKGALPEDHPLSLGVFSNSGDEAVREFVAQPETDVLLVAGTSLGEVSSCGWDTRLAKKESLLQIDIDPGEIGRNFPVDIALPGDAGTVLTELRHHMERNIQKNRPGTFPRHGSPIGIARHDPPPPAPQDGAPLSPLNVLEELRRALPREAVIFVDNGTIRTWAGRYLPIYRENSFFVNMGLASMGYATAGCIGGALADPARPVVALVGDAAFAMNGLEVHTAVEYDVPVIWIVINNGGHGMIHHGARMLYGEKFRSPIFKRRLPITQIAAALGAETFLAEKPGDLAAALSRSISRRIPIVIEVTTDLRPVPPMGARVQAIQKELVPA